MALIVSRGPVTGYRIGRVRVIFQGGALDTPCHVWQGAKLPSGYPRCADDLAHRRAWRLAHGREIPAGMHVHHVCERRDCVNPDHLELVTPTEHAARHPQVPA